LEFERERTEFLVTSGGELSTIGLDGTPITLPAWKRKFVESDLRDLQSEGYIRLDTVLRPGGSLRFHKGSVTPQAREEFHRRKVSPPDGGTSGSTSTGGHVEPPKTLPEPLLPGYRLDQYKILEQIGEGGRARVYEAVDTTFDDVVAVLGCSSSCFWCPSSSEGRSPRTRLAYWA